MAEAEIPVAVTFKGGIGVRSLRDSSISDRIEYRLRCCRLASDGRCPRSALKNREYRLGIVFLSNDWSLDSQNGISWREQQK
jgi:hypothetical protein